VQTYVTVGYGDITVTGNVERIFAVTIMLIGVFIFSYAAGSVASIMANLDEQEAIINQRKLALANLTHVMKFPPALVVKIKEAVEFQAPKGTEDIQHLLKGLPFWLRQKVMIEVNKDMEEAFPIF